MTTIRSAGDAALLVQVDGPASGDPLDGNEAAKLAAAIGAAALRGVTDVVPGACTVLVRFEPGSWAPADLAGQLCRIAGAPLPGLAGVREPALVLDTWYDGPDLPGVAALTGLSVGEVIRRHEAAEYRVGWLGFSPGFGYLTGLDPLLAAAPRLDSPRLAVPAGSVAIAGGLAAVYPAASPGGWQLIGRTDAVLWDVGRNPPALFAPGRRVRFRSVTGPSPVTLMSPVSRPSPVTPASPVTLMSPVTPASPATPRLVQVLQPGPLATVQDLGRPGFAHVGVPRSGAADQGALRLANRLAGNDDAAACLEATLGRLALRFDFDAIVALTGAPAPVSLSPGGDQAHETAFAVPAGSVLRLGSPAAGLRSYLAIAGGIDIPPVLGSRSADLLSGLGPAPLRPGEWLPVGRLRSRPDGPAPATRDRAARAPHAAARVVLRAAAGPRDDWFEPSAVATLTGGSYQVSAASNRTALRLTGPALRPVSAGELPSEGVTAGSLQVSHDGQPILLLADHPATGGYPVIAVVVTADLGLAAQLRPGQQVRFAVGPASGSARL